MSRHYGDSSIWPCPFFVALISLAKHSPLFCLGLGARLLSELKDVYRQLAFAMCFWTIAHSLPPFARSPPFPSLPRKRLDGPSLEWAKKRDDWPQWLAAIKRLGGSWTRARIQEDDHWELNLSYEELQDLLGPLQEAALFLSFPSSLFFLLFFFIFFCLISCRGY